MARPIDEDAVRRSIEEHLAEVIDPGAGLDVFRMGLVRGLTVTDDGDVFLTFRPSSPVCPMAFTLAPAIKGAIQSVPGVTGVLIHVENFNRADELEALLAEGSAGITDPKTGGKRRQAEEGGKDP